LPKGVLSIARKVKAGIVEATGIGNPKWRFSYGCD
jgi:hypothetical protein